MDCQEFLHHHIAFADDESLAGSAADARAHLDACPRCEARYVALQRGLMVARSLAPVRPTAGFRARLAAAITAETRVSARRREVRAAVYFAHGSIAHAHVQGRAGERRVRAGVSLSR